LLALEAAVKFGQARGAGRENFRFVDLRFQSKKSRRLRWAGIRDTGGVDDMGYFRRDTIHTGASISGSSGYKK